MPHRPSSAPLADTKTRHAADLRPVLKPTVALGDRPPAAAPPRVPRPAPLVPGYVIRGELGQGGMGVVYDALDTRLNRPVALKLLSDDLAGDPAQRARLRDEAEAVARLRHPNVVQIYEVGDLHGRPFLALERVDGGTLADRLDAGPLPPADAVAVVRAVALAVHHAHECGVVHRDLKPANILLEGDGGQESGDREDGRPSFSSGPAPAPCLLSPKVTDFGLAKLLDDDRGRTRTGTILGTPAYMAPELVGGGRVSPLVDVYALGAVLYECLTGRPPAEGPTLWETLRRAAEDDPDPPSRVRPGVPRGLDAVCLKALAKDPAGRYPTAAALADDLARFAAGRRVRARRAGVARRLFRSTRRRPVIAAAALLVGGLLAGTAALGAVHYRERTADARESVRAGREMVARGSFTDAELAAAHGLQRLGGLPGTRELKADLDRLRRTARRGRHTADLRGLVDRLRYGFDADALAGADLRAVADAADGLWATRDTFAAAADTDLGPDLDARLRADLLDLALLSADLRVRQGGDTPAARKSAARRLDEAEATLGRDPVLAHVRLAYARGDHPSPIDAGTTWGLYALGRARLTAGDAGGAAALFARAVEREPGAFWPNFYAAVCAHHRGRWDEAAAGFTTCLAVAPGRRAVCYYNRALAVAGPGTPEAAARAVADLDRALALEPGLAEAVHHRRRLLPKVDPPAGRAAAAGQ